MINIKSSENQIMKLYRNIDTLDIVDYEVYLKTSLFNQRADVYLYIDAEENCLSLIKYKQNMLKIKLEDRLTIDELRVKIKELLEEKYIKYRNFIEPIKATESDFKNVISNQEFYDTFEPSSLIKAAIDCFEKNDECNNVQLLPYIVKLFKLFSDDELINAWTSYSILEYTILVGEERFKELFRKLIVLNKPEFHKSMNSPYTYPYLYSELINFGYNDLLEEYLNIVEDDYLNTLITHPAIRYEVKLIALKIKAERG